MKIDENYLKGQFNDEATEIRTILKSIIDDLNSISYDSNISKFNKEQAIQFANETIANIDSAQKSVNELVDLYMNAEKSAMAIGASLMLTEGTKFWESSDKGGSGREGVVGMGSTPIDENGKCEFKVSYIAIYQNGKCLAVLSKASNVTVDEKIAELQAAGKIDTNSKIEIARAVSMVDKDNPDITHDRGWIAPVEYTAKTSSKVELPNNEENRNENITSEEDSSSATTKIVPEMMASQLTDLYNLFKSSNNFANEKGIKNPVLTENENEYVQNLEEAYKYNKAILHEYEQNFNKYPRNSDEYKSLQSEYNSLKLLVDSQGKVLIESRTNTKRNDPISPEDNARLKKDANNKKEELWKYCEDVKAKNPGVGFDEGDKNLPSIREYALSEEDAYEQNLERMKSLEENGYADTEAYTYLEEITKKQKEFIDAVNKVQ